MTRRRRNDLTSPRSNRRAFRRWHRYCGFSAALFVLALATTGLMLNHSAELGLGSRHIGFAPLLAWYDIEGDSEITSFSLAESWVSCIGDGTFLDREPLPALDGCPVGAVNSVGMWVVVTARELVLLTEGGELIERLGPAAGVPGGISAAGIRPDGALVVDTPAGSLVADRELLQWQLLGSDAEVTWSRPATAPPDLRDELLRGYRGHGLTVERFVQDLHSGRLFGRWGIYVMDGAAVLLLTLVVSGLALWRRGSTFRRT